MTTRAQRGPLLQELTRGNPWWTSPNWAATDLHLTTAARAPFERVPSILADITPPNLYTLRGPRRAGKSTLIKQTIARLIDDGIDPRRICYFAADALATFTDLINLFQAARLLFPDLADTPRFFLIDEVTAIPEWQRGVKWLRDNTSVANDCLVATGSSARDIAGGATHLAGRRGPATSLDRLLWPMAFPDFARCAGFTLPSPPRLPLDAFYIDEGRAACQAALIHLGTLVDAFDAYLLIGGFPQAVADFRRTAQVSGGLARDLWDIVQSDLLRLGVSRPEQGLRLLERIAASLTGPVVLRSLAEDLGVSHPTASAWLDALADAYLILPVYQERNGAPDLRKQRKIYPIDPLLARLPANQAPGVAEPDTSRIAEAALAMALHRSLAGGATDRPGPPGRLFFYRTPDATEIDFLALPQRLVAEAKYVDTASTRDGRAMVTHFGGGLLLTHGAVDLQPGLTILPAAVFAWLLSQPG